MTNLNLKWGKPHKFESNYGERWKRECLIPTEHRPQFFDYWRSNSVFLKQKGFGVYKKDKDWFVTETKSQLNEFKEFKDSPTDSPKPEKPLFNLIPKEVKNPSGLRPWQTEVVGKLHAALEQWGSAIDGSEMGIGKTYSSIGVVRELNVFFTVICPKAVISQWENVINNHFKLKSKCIGIINYESLIRGKKESKIASYVKNKKTHINDFVWKLPKDSIIIWDEAHKLKNFTTKNSKTCMKAYKQGYRQIFLSASIAHTPLEMRTIGTCLKMFSGPKEYYQFLYKSGCVKGRWGFQFNNDKSILQKIHKSLFSERGTRLRRDCIPNFPECEIQVDPYNLDDESTKKVNEIYAEMHKELKRIDKKTKKDENGDDTDNELTIRIRARQKTEMLKIPLIQEMVEEAIIDGMSVVVFLNYCESIDALANRLNTKCIFDGRVGDKIREVNKKNFQDNKERVIIINSAAGSVGLNLGDETGNYPRISIISPDDSAVKIKQIQGRIWREYSKSKSINRFVFISGTIEEIVSNNVKQKLDNMESINDGDLKL